MFKFLYLGKDEHTLAGVGRIQPGVPFEASAVHAAFLRTDAKDQYKELSEEEAAAIEAEITKKREAAKKTAAKAKQSDAKENAPSS